MVFIDGENLVFRYQEMLKLGYVPRDDLVHERDVFVWHDSFTWLAQYHEIIRATYYTNAVGDEPYVASLRARLKVQTYTKHMASLLPNSLAPCIFKKDSRTRSAKGVDVKLTVDALSHVHRRNTDAILLMSGDGDYVPLVDEVQRSGVQVFLSAFSSGLSPRLRERVDALYELDGTTWKSRPADSAAGA